MKILMISGDRSLLDPASSAAQRLALMRAQVEQLDVFGYVGFWSGPRGGFEVLSAIMRTHYDVITVQEAFWRGLLAWLAARVSGATLNIQVHTNLSAQPFWRQWLARFVLQRADSIRVVSEQLKQQLAPFRLRAKVSILPIYVDLPKFSSVVRRPHASKNILWIGRFEEEKNPLQAIEILKEVLTVIPSAQLTMIGSGTFEQALSQKVANLPIQIPVGWRNPLLYLDTADVVLSTSRHESYGASIIEALAAGVPVVAPDIGIAREAGAIIAPRKQLANAVILVLQSDMRGELKLRLPSAEEWAREWRTTLI